MWTTLFSPALETAAVMIDHVNYLHPVLWLGVLILSIAVESVTSEMVSIWFAPAALVSLILSFYFNFTVQLIAFAVLSVILIVLAKTVFRRALNKKTEEEKSGVDQLIGQSVVVVEPIDNEKETGAVRVNGQLWTARTESDVTKAAEGDHLEIVQVCGAKLICRPVSHQ